MPTAEVLDERVPGADHLYAAELCEAAHRPESGLHSAVVGFDPVIGVGLGVVPGARSQLIKDGRVDRCLVGDDLGRGRPVLECLGEELAPSRRIARNPPAFALVDLTGITTDVRRELAAGPIGPYFRQTTRLDHLIWAPTSNGGP